ncbi:MAG: hypothetical protein ACTSRU_02720, partial [Candidatus Hodarchaeales archaeon]
MASFNLSEIQEIVYSLKHIFPGQKSLLQLEKDKSTAGFFAKRGINKKISKLQKDLETIKPALLSAILEEYKEIWQELVDNIKKVALIIPKQTSIIQQLDPPVESEYESVVSFAKDISSTYRYLVNVLNGEASEILLSNRETLEKYRRYVEVNEEKVPATSKTTIELLNINKLVELLDTKAKLQEEKRYLENRKNEVERRAILNLGLKNSTLSKNIDAAQSLNINVPGNIIEELKEIISESEEEQSFSQTFALEKRVDKLTLEFLTHLRTELISIKTLTENQIGRIQTIYGFSTVTFEEPPGVNVSSMDGLELCRHIESIRSWQQKVLFAVKKLLNTQEFKSIIRKCSQKKIEIPDELIKKVNVDLAKTMDKTKDLDEAVSVLKKYVSVKSQIAEIIRKQLLTIVQNEELIPIIEVFNEPPKINLETSDPEILLRQHDEVQKWEKIVSTYLQGLTGDVNAIISHLNKINQLMDLDPGYKANLVALNKKIAKEQNINRLLVYRKDVLAIKKQIIEDCVQTIENSIHDTELSRIVALSHGPEPPVIASYDSSKFTDVIQKLDQIRTWKNQLIKHLRDTRDIDQTIILAEGVQQFGVELEQDFFQSLKTLKENIREQDSDINSLGKLNREKEKLIGDFQSLIRERIRSLIKTHESLQLDTSDLKEIRLEGDLKTIVASLENVYKWLSTKRSTLIDENKSVRALLGKYKELEKMNVVIPEMMKRNLDSIAQSAFDLSDSDVITLAQRLMSMNEIKEKLTILTEQQVQQEIENVKMQMSVLNSVPSQLNLSLPSFIEEQYNIRLKPGELDKAMELLRSINDWKTVFVQSIINTVHGIEIMILPVETEYDLRRERQLLLDEMKKIKEVEVIVVKYVNFISKLEKTREEILGEIKKLRTELRVNHDKIKKMAIANRVFNQFKLVVPVDRQIDEYNYSFVLQEWWNLTKEVMSATEKLIEIIEKEIFSMAEDFNFPPPHSDKFTDIVSYLMNAYNEIKEKNSISGVIEMFEMVKKDAIDISQFCYEKFSREISSSLTVALPRMSEVSEIPLEVLGKAKAIQSRFNTFSDLSKLSHSIRETIHDYEEIVNTLQNIARAKSNEVLETIRSLKAESGMDLTGKIPGLITKTANIPPSNKMSLNDVSDVFTAIDTFKSNAAVNDGLRMKCRGYVKEIEKSVLLVSELYSFDLKDHLKAFFDFLEEFDSLVQQNDFFALTELAVSLVQIRNEVVEAIKNLETTQHDRTEADLNNYNSY